MAPNMLWRPHGEGIGARFVYVLRSDSDPSRHYVGRATDVDERLEWHNMGRAGTRCQHRPWSIVVSSEFPNERAAAHFEKYLEVRLRPRVCEAPLRAAG